MRHLLFQNDVEIDILSCRASVVRGSPLLDIDVLVKGLIILSEPDFVFIYLVLFWKGNDFSAVVSRSATVMKKMKDLFNFMRGGKVEEILVSLESHLVS